MSGQLEFAQRAIRQLQPILLTDIELLISHGNGPQVGHILTRVEQSLGQAYSIPLEVCVADTQAGMGYMISQCLVNALHRRGVDRDVTTVVTTVVVDEDDPYAGYEVPDDLMW